jgi:hypothetical protein
MEQRGYPQLMCWCCGSTRHFQKDCPPPPTNPIKMTDAGYETREAARMQQQPMYIESERPGGNVHRGPRTAGQNDPYASSVGASPTLGETADRDIPRNTPQKKINWDWRNVQEGDGFTTRAATLHTQHVRKPQPCQSTCQAMDRRESMSHDLDTWVSMTIARLVITTRLPERPAHVMPHADGTRKDPDDPKGSFKLTLGWHILSVHRQYHQPVHPGTWRHARPWCIRRFEAPSATTGRWSATAVLRGAITTISPYMKGNRKVAAVCCNRAMLVWLEWPLAGTGSRTTHQAKARTPVQSPREVPVMMTTDHWLQKNTEGRTPTKRPWRSRWVAIRREQLGNSCARPNA